MTKFFIARGFLYTSFTTLEGIMNCEAYLSAMAKSDAKLPTKHSKASKELIRQANLVRN